MSDISLSKAVRSNLLSLQTTATMMNKTQERLATGNKVNSALDNPSNFFTATSLNSRAADMSNLLDSMASGIKVIEAANNGLTALTKNLESMQSTLRQARQDKSFQTKSFDVTDASVIKLAGGSVGELPTEISLATATVAGEKASVGTTGNAAYLGPAIDVTAQGGAGARSIIDLNSGVAQNDKFTVAGVEVTATNASPNATNLAADIKAKLQADSSTKDKYTVSVGAGGSANAGKIVIETIDTTAAAATVNLDPDMNATTGVDAATKGKTSFNYSAITSQIQAGNQTIDTGSSFDEFVTNLTAKGKEGGYTVKADTTTKQITLEATAYGAAAPAVVGIPNANAGSAGTKATTTFTLANTANITNTTQELTVAGITAKVNLTAGMNKTQVEAAFALNTELTDKYEVTVSNSLAVELKEKVPTSTLAGPTVTSNKGAAGAVASSVTASGGYQFTTNTAANVAGSDLEGLTITLEDGDGNSDATFSFGNTGTVSSKVTALQSAATAAGYTVVADDQGLSFTRSDGKAFKINLSGGANGATGLGGGSTTINVNAGTEVGLTGGNAAVAHTGGIAAQAAVNGKTTTAPSSTGASVETAAAAKNEFTVSYDGKTANVSIAAVKGGSGPDAIAANALDINKWQSATVASVNAQLEAKGITGVEGKFDSAGKFSIVAKAAEAKTLAVSGNDSVALFGTSSVDTGVAEKSQLNATKTVDKFVELINRDHGGKVRASNDNGKLRIENLSTQALDIGVDTNGNDVVNSMKVDGNAVRDNLHKQFNELRDQMDKLSDDASFNGINLLRGDKLTITFNESGSSSLDIQSKDKSDNARSINASNLGIDSLDAMDLDSDAGIDAFLSKISTALSDIRSQASAFGSNLSSVENRQTFTKSMINTLETGAANLTLADMNEEAANVLALQTRQSLSSSALSMASQADQSILQLLR